MIKRWVYVALAFGLGMSAMSCENQKFNDVKVDVDRVHVDELSPEMIKVRDYVPEYAVIAHRGSTFWTPEETESAYRWAREIGADYLECDMQVSKDGVVLALHDDNLKHRNGFRRNTTPGNPEELLYENRILGDRSRRKGKSG